MAGGSARAAIFPRLDSIAWQAPGIPAIDRILGFDRDDGIVGFVDSRGQPRRLDLRTSEVRLASREKLSSIASANGSHIYGVTERGTIARLTPTGDWTFEPPSPARWVFPQANGFVVVAGNQGNATHLWLIRPTDDDILASATLPLVSRGVRTQVGDRLYFTADTGLIGVRTRDLTPVRSVRMREPVAAVVPTPSGDRLYVAREGRSEILIVDRYSEEISARVAVPGPVSDLRMDPLGQIVLARPQAGGDSVWVIAVGTDRHTGTLQSAWRDDLPAFAPGPSIATLRGGDVVFVEGADLRDTRTVRNGAADFWYFLAWNGFRPRAAGLDRPVTFEIPDTPAPPPRDSLGGIRLADPLPDPPLRDAAPSMVEPPARPTAYLVSFAALLSEQRAIETAAGISVNGVRPRVVAGQSGATPVFRVVLGPYPTREEADRIGRDSRRQYWVYEDTQ